MVDVSESVEVFNTAINAGHKLNKYGLAMYLLSIWKLNKDKAQVQNLFSTLGEKRCGFNELFQFAPPLEEVDL